MGCNGDMIQLAGSKGIQDSNLYSSGAGNLYVQNIVQTNNFVMSDKVMQENPSLGQKQTYNVPHSGDFASDMWVRFTAPQLSPLGNPGWVNGIGHAAITNAALHIGSICIDKWTGMALHVWEKLYVPPQVSSDELMGYGQGLGARQTWTQRSNRTFFVPMRFYMSQRASSNALQMLRMQFHNINVQVNFANSPQLVNTGGAAPFLSDGVTNLNDTNFFQGGCNLQVNYVYIGHAVRNQLATTAYNQLIQQVQILGSDNNTGTTLSTNEVLITFNHPVVSLEFLFRLKSRALTDYNWHHFDFSDTTGTVSPLLNAALSFNQNSKVDTDVGVEAYFRLVQPSMYYQNIPGDLADATNTEFIFAYSFSLNPAVTQPLGSANFSRIDTTKLNVNFIAAETSLNAFDVFVMGHNFNVIAHANGIAAQRYAS